MIKGIIFDFNRTLYLPEINKIPEKTVQLLNKLKNEGFGMALLAKKEKNRNKLIEKVSFFFIIIKQVNKKSEKDFIYILDKLNFKKKEAIVIGDRIKSEIKIANKAGIKTIWYRNGKFKDELPNNKYEYPNYTITEIEELPKLLNRLNLRQNIMELQLPKGTKDIPVEKKIIKNKVVNALNKVFEIYGYSPLETPILERYETLAGKYAGGSEILKEMFKLKDQGKRVLGLRYDLTVPFARYIAMNPNIKMPFKRYQIGQVFRDGPIKLGRYREFWQCDVDVVGVMEMSAEAELLALTKDCFQKMGLDVIIKINNRKLLNGILISLGIKNIEDVILTIDKIEKIPLSDFKKELRKKKSKENQIKEIIKIFKENEIDSIKGKIDNEEGRQGIKEIKKLQEFLKILEVNAKIDISLARGLSYYTGTVFEVFLKDSEIKGSVAAGGRYDKMIGNFIGKGEYPAVGISFGLDVVCDAIKKTEKLTVADVYIIPIRNLDKCFKIAKVLRKSDIKVDIDLMEKGLSKNLEYANVKKIPYVLICGPDELNQNKVKLKDMITGKEELISLKDIVDKLKDLVKYDL